MSLTQAALASLGQTSYSPETYREEDPVPFSQLAKVRVSVTSQISLYNPGTTGWEYAGLSALSYDVSILAAVAA